MSYQDGTFSSPVINGPKSISFPLLNGANPDKYARVIKRNYVVSLDAYSPTAGNRTSWSNLLTYSSDQGNAAWVATNTSKSANNIANPWDGGVTATRVLETAASGTHLVGQAYTFSAFQYTAYFIAKGGLGRDWICVRAFDGTTDRQCFFNLTTCAVGAASGATGSIVGLNDGWCLCIIVFTAGAGAGSLNLLLSNDGSALSYAGDTARGCYVAHAQLDATGADGPLVITTNVARSISAPPTDRSQNSASDSSADPFAYLVAESEVEPLGGNWTFSRTYARIPAARTDYSNRLVIRPLVDDYHLNTGSANYWAATVDNGLTFHVFSSLSNTVCGIVPLTNNTLFNFQTVNHGAAVGDAWIAWSGNKITGRGTVRQVFDVNNFYAFTSDLVGENVTGITAMSLAKNGTRYVVEPAVSVSVIEASAFYMANVSANITTPADIPLFSPQVDAVSWMNAVVTNANYAVAEGTAVEAWNGWPIYRATTASVEMSDAKVVVSASA